MQKALRIIGAVAGALLLLLVVIFLMVHEVMRPEPVAPIAASPSVVVPQFERTAVEAESRCSLQVQIIDGDGAPVAAAAVTLHGKYTDEEAVLVTGISGWTERTSWPCEVVHVSAADGAERTPTMGLLLSTEDEVLTLALAGSVRIFGSITGEDGEDVEHASLTNGNHVEVATGGRYEIWVPAEDTFVTVTARGYSTEYIPQLNLPAEGPPEIEHDLVLLNDERVEVFCAGLPEDQCRGIYVSCSTPLMPLGDGCSHLDGRTLCPCPEGEAAVRGGGRTTLVGAQDTEAWLDFRDTGSISGRLVDSGQAVAWSEVGVMRVPMGLEDLPRGLMIGQETESRRDGTFTLLGMVSGDWEIIIRGSDGEVKRVLQPVRLRVGEHKDIGDIELWAGGGIEGVLIDGMTGEPKGGMVLALRQAHGDERTMPMGARASWPTGAFTMAGIPAGSWRVFSPESPHQPVMVTVEDGSITDGVEVIIAEATSLSANGFSLTSEDGLLIVDGVDPGSPADDAGLRAGDEVIGIQLAGFQIGDFRESGGLKLGRFLLGNYDGPGVTLVVEQDGEALDIPLEW